MGNGKRPSGRGRADRELQSSISWSVPVFRLSPARFSASSALNCPGRQSRACSWNQSNSRSDRRQDPCASDRRGVRKELEQIRLETKQVEVNLLRAMNAQTRWLLGGLAVLGVVLKLADLILA
jgi:hypothetical protein